jgi:hypothetical protein
VKVLVNKKKITPRKNYLLAIKWDKQKQNKA